LVCRDETPKELKSKLIEFMITVAEKSRRLSQKLMHNDNVVDYLLSQTTELRDVDEEDD